MLKRVSKQVEQKQQSYNQTFVPKYEINHRLNEGEWKEFYLENMDLSILDFINIIQEAWGYPTNGCD